MTYNVFGGTLNLAQFNRTFSLEMSFHKMCVIFPLAQCDIYCAYCRVLEAHAGQVTTGFSTGKKLPHAALSS